VAVTVATIAERSLRRLGISIVPVADRPALNTRVAPGDIANAALIELGVIATDTVPPSQASIVPVDTIATLALVKLGVIASDETPAATDLTLARDALTAVHNALVGQGAVDWTTAAITTAVSEEYAGLTSAHLAPSFGKASDPALVPMLEGRIRTVSKVKRAYNQALAAVQQVQASLISQANVGWDNNGIPTAVATEYTTLVAAVLASSFGQKTDPAQTEIMEKRVRRMAQILAAPESAEAAVQSVHDVLVARGLARWSVWDIPVACEISYEMLAANRLAPLFDQKADAGEEVLATRTLLQIIALPTSGEIMRAVYF
jgi:hypothetical protein